MPLNYGDNAGPGDVRRRVCRVTCENLNQLEVPGFVPYALFREEDAVALATAGTDGATERSLGFTRELRTEYSPVKLIAIRNPGTDAHESVGRLPADLSMAECFAVLYSLGRQAQTDADDSSAT